MWSLGGDFLLNKPCQMASKPQKKLNLIHKVTLVDKFIAYLKPKLQYFVRHNFVVN
jgi:hypothetical protein